MTVGTSNIKSQSTIKALGITIDKDLKRTQHVNDVVKKVTSLSSGLRIATRHLNIQQSLCIITSQIFSIIYYAAPVWLTSELGYNNLKRIEPIHYSTLRIGLKDFKKSQSREKINLDTKRMPPQTWMLFCTASTAMKIIRDEAPSNLHNKIMANAYKVRRKENFIYTYDNSHNKLRKKGFHNWINHILRRIKFP